MKLNTEHKVNLVEGDGKEIIDGITVYTGGRGDGTHVYAPILIDSPRTLDFDLSGPAPTPAVP